MTDNAILWTLLVGAVFWYGWRRGKNRRQGAASTGTAATTGTAASAWLSSVAPVFPGGVDLTHIGHYYGTHDPRSAQNWPKPASTPPDPQLGLPDLSIL